jgi:glyoxylase-like metal-dependent hydrolase (beta-lactamase superfamily II)
MMDTRFTQVTPHLLVFRDHINIGVLRDGERALLVDFGSGAIVSALHDIGITTIDTALFTHHHRDQACGILRVIDEIRRWVTGVSSTGDRQLSLLLPLPAIRMAV